VPCGLNSNSNSPLKYCLINSEFSPTYDEIIFFTCLDCSNKPIPKSSTPALLEAIIRFLIPDIFSAAIDSSGIPHRPKPPAAIFIPSKINPSIACSAE
jgi:hypothetical protein